jgi:beta-lactamase superfamily II metal-dependent hydrolase
VLILDVGHGNCTIVRDAGVVAVIDGPMGSALLDTLEELEVSHVDHAVISHADADHIQGILALLTSDRITVGSLYVNPDRDRKTAAWRDLIHAVTVADRSNAFRTVPSLTTDTTPLRVGGLTMTVVSPSAALALSAVGGLASAGGINSANTLSAVIKVERYPNLGVLLAGDLDNVALTDIQTSGVRVVAAALVFPHHGGLPGGGSAKTFGNALLQLVGPTQVYISNGRNKHGNPRSEVVEAVLDRGCGLACTQLAIACGEPVSADHLEPWPAAGRAAMHSCAGTVSLALTENGPVRAAGPAEAFRTYVATRVSAPLCARTKH